MYSFFFFSFACFKKILLGVRGGERKKDKKDIRWKQLKNVNALEDTVSPFCSCTQNQFRLDQPLLHTRIWMAKFVWCFLRQAGGHIPLRVCMVPVDEEFLPSVLLKSWGCVGVYNLKQLHSHVPCAWCPGFKHHKDPCYLETKNERRLSHQQALFEHVVADPLLREAFPLASLQSQNALLGSALRARSTWGLC